MATMPTKLHYWTFVTQHGKHGYGVTHKSWASNKIRLAFFSSKKIAESKATAFCSQYSGVAVAINDPEHPMYKHDVFGPTGPFAGLFATRAKLDRLDVKIDLSKV